MRSVNGDARNPVKRVLIEQSGYDLLNIGDLAMLAAGIGRVREAWPDADIEVVGYDEAGLAEHLPDSALLGPLWSERPGIRRLPVPVKIGFEQAYKTLTPLLPAFTLAFRPAPARGRRSIRRAVADSDVVIATGGGYVCDAFWWHGAGVLSALYLAQRMGKPTAMFGQGIGPLRNPFLTFLARRVLGRLDALGLREPLLSVTTLSTLRITDSVIGFAPSKTRRSGVVAISGDSALSIASTPVTKEQGITPATRSRPRIGVNLRVSAYAGIVGPVRSEFASTLWRVADQVGADLFAIPISRYPDDADLPAIRRTLGRLPEGRSVELPGEDLKTPSSLAIAVHSCRLVVSGSYHAAVFAVAQGIPTIAISASSYYDAKFAGLSALFPEAVTVIQLDSGTFAGDLENAVLSAFELCPSDRAATRDRALRQVAAEDMLFCRFVEQAEKIILDEHRAVRGRVW